MKTQTNCLLVCALLLCTTAHAADKPNYWDRSVQSETAGNLEQALKEIFNYAAEGGDRYLASLRAGWLYYQLQDDSQALKFYEAAAQAAPSAISPRLGAATVAYRQKDWNMVQRYAEAVLKLDPINTQANLYLGEAAFQTRHYADAVRIFGQMQSRYPEDTTVLSWLAWSTLYKGNGREARIAFARLLILSPDYPLAAQGLAAASKY